MMKGIHASAAGGMMACLGRVSRMGIPVAQVFTASPRRYAGTPPAPDTAAEFRGSSGGITFISHGSYLINPASPDQGVRRRSAAALEAELERCSILGIPLCVIHPGSAAGGNTDRAAALAAGVVRKALERSSPDVTLLLENTCGSGNSLGGDFDQLLEIASLAGAPERVGVCIDTAHAHGFGYRLDSPAAAADFCGEVEDIFRGRLRAFHLNDSKVERGSRRDRHAGAGKGSIGLSALARIGFHPAFDRLPAVVETPGTDSDRVSDLHRIILEHRNIDPP